MNEREDLQQEKPSTKLSPVVQERRTNWYRLRLQQLSVVEWRASQHGNV